jgi:hypothetical protein
MTPSSAKKQGLRYRYYVSRAQIEGAADLAGSLTRLAAPAIETAVLEALASLAEQSPSNDMTHPALSEPRDPRLLLNMVERVIVPRGFFMLVFTFDARDRLHRDCLDVAFSPRPSREVLAPNEPNARTMASEQRSTLAAAIARGRLWLDELTAGRTELLSPKIVQGAIDSSLPKGVSMSRLLDLPMDWRLRHRALGID